MTYNEFLMIKKRMKKAVIMLAIVATIGSLASCYTYETVTNYRYESLEGELNNKYRGYTRTQIINEYGAPERIVPIDASSVILVYESFSSSISRPTDPLGLGLGSYRETKERIFTEFYLDNSSKCYKVKSNRVNVIPYQETIKKSAW